MSEWTTLSKLSECGVLHFGDGYRTKKLELRRSGYRIIRVADIRENRVILESPDFVSDEFIRQIGHKAARPGDVVLTTKGTVGRVAVMPEMTGSAVYSPQVCWFRVEDSTQLSGRYLSYWLRSEEFLSQASYMQGNSDMAPYISLSDLRKAQLVLPSLQKQQAIAEVLGAFDDKIAANTKLAAIADELNSAFLRASIQVDSEVLPIETLTELLVRGSAPKYVEVDASGMLVLNQKCVRGKRVSTELARWTDPARVKEERVLSFGDVLVNSTGQGTLGRVARWTGAQQVTVDSHITIVRIDGTKRSQIVLGQAILEAEGRIEALGEGSTGQTELSRRELGKLELRVPSSRFDKQLEAVFRATITSSDTALQENHTLAETRDALLPQLMSGKIRVRDAEKLASEAGA